MPRYFTHYWRNDTWESRRERADGSELSHTAGNLFRRRGVRPGDFIYVVTVLKGRLFLGSKMEVDKILSQREAKAELGNDIWQASEHIIGKTGTHWWSDREVPLAVARRLRFKTSDGAIPPLFVPGGGLYKQTLRGVRELTKASAAELDRLLKV